MNAAHLHLLINHAPVFWIPVCMLLLLAALVRGDQTLARAGLAAYALTALATVIVLLTGDPAAHALRGVPEVTRALVHHHDEAATVATAILGVVGALALLALYVFRRQGVPRWAALAGLVAGAIALGAMGWASGLGGQIRHPEARPGWTAPPAPPRTHPS